MPRAMKDKVKLFGDRLSEAVSESLRFCFMSRGKEFQQEACEKLSLLRQDAVILKAEMVSQADEDSANAMLSFEGIVDSVISELKMWIALKEDDPHVAWDCLVDAQGAIRAALWAHPVAQSFAAYPHHLQLLKFVLFPPQLFLSSRLVVASSECSICGGEYGECDHVKGRAYMGRMCTEIVNEIAELRSVDVVRNPANPHCRIMQFTDGGVMRDYMTWRIISER